MVLPEAAIAMPAAPYDLYTLALARAQAAAGDRSSAVHNARAAAAERDLRQQRCDLEYSREAATELAKSLGS